MNKTVDVVQQFISATNADTYHYRLVNPITEQVKLGTYSPEQLAKAIPFLQAQNLNGFNIYVRPNGYQYVLLDDLTRNVLAELATLKPCLLMETSPGNFQAWLTLADVPGSRDEAKRICHTLAVRFNADVASAEPDHVGRLPGFTNRKAKHRKPNGQYPYVLLHRWEHRLSTFHPFGGAVVNEATATAGRRTTGKGGISEQDFGVAYGLIKFGKSEQQVYEHLLNTSPNLRERKGNKVDSYLRRTIKKAIDRQG